MQTIIDERPGDPPEVKNGSSLGQASTLLLPASPSFTSVAVSMPAGSKLLLRPLLRARHC